MVFDLVHSSHRNKALGPLLSPFRLSHHTPSLSLPRTSNHKKRKSNRIHDKMPAATKPSCARVRVASSAASAVSIPSRRRAAGPARPAAPSTPGASVSSYSPLRRRGTIQAAALSSGGNASSTAAPSIGSSRGARTNDDAFSALFLPDAFALLGLNRAAARASVIQAYEEAAGNEIEEGFSKV